MEEFCTENNLTKCDYRHQLVPGWVSQPDTRGTLDILWACASTIFVCVWVMLHLNVPAADDTYFVITVRKTKWFIMAMLAPELVMLFAAGQWAAAHRSVQDMRSLDLKWSVIPSTRANIARARIRRTKKKAGTDAQWSMVHAMYAESGGFMFQGKSGDDDDDDDGHVSGHGDSNVTERDNINGPFPVTAKQVFYLVKHKYIDPPTITRQEIWDKSKADRFAKMIAVLQGGWFTLQIITRAAQRLDISLLELSTLCLMTCTAATLFFWFHKPLDVTTPSLLKSKTVSVATILAEAKYDDDNNSSVLVSSSPSIPAVVAAATGGANTSIKDEKVACHQTDVEEGRKEPGLTSPATAAWQDTPLDFVEGLQYTSTQFPLNKYWGEQRRPLPRIPNDRDSLLHNWKIVVTIAIPTAAFGTLQLIAWNFHFPSRHEQLLWRYTCLANGIVLGIGCVLEAGAIMASGYKLPGLRTFRDYKMKWPWCLSFYLAGVMYVTARMVVIVEVLVSLRALPASCFVNVEWTNFLPHA